MPKSAAEKANNILRAVAIRYARQKVGKVGQKGVLGPDGDKLRDRMMANPEKIPDEVWDEGEYENYERLLKAAEKEGSDDEDGSDDDEKSSNHDEGDSDSEQDEEEAKVIHDSQTRYRLASQPIKRKATSSIPKAMSVKKVKIDDGAGPSGSYMVMKEWAKLEAKMEMKQEEMDKKLSNYLGSYTAKLDAMLNEAQKKIDQHGEVVDVKVANAEKAAEMAKQSVEDLKGTTIRTVEYTANKEYESVIRIKAMGDLCKLMSVNPELGNVMAAKMGIDLTSTEKGGTASPSKPRTRGGAAS